MGCTAPRFFLPTERKRLVVIRERPLQDEVVEDLERDNMLFYYHTSLTNQVRSCKCGGDGRGARVYVCLEEEEETVKS